MSTPSKSGSPAYIKWGAGILLVLAFAFAWYIIASQSDSAKADETQAPAAVETTVDSVTNASVAEVTPVSPDSLEQSKLGKVLSEAAQSESVEPYAPADEN